MSLAELRDKANEQLATLQRMRDEWHEYKQRDDVGDAELDERKKKIAEARAAFDATCKAIDERQDESELDEYLERANARDFGNDDPTKPPKRKKRSKRTPLDEDFLAHTGADDPETKARAERCAALGMQAWLCRQAGIDLTDAHRQALREQKEQRGVQYSGRELRFGLSANRQFRALQQLHRMASAAGIGEQAFITRAMSALEGAKGGYAAPQGFINTIENNQLHYSGVLQVAEIFRTTHGNEIPWPTADDTSNEGEIVGASSNVEGSTEPTLDKITFRAYKSHAKMIKVPYELLEDWQAAMDLADWLANIIAERLGRHRNNVYTTASAGNSPDSIVQGASLGLTAASQTQLTGDEVIRMIYKVDEAYRMGAGFMMHDNVWLEVQLLKDDDGRYIHTPGLDAAARETIRGYPRFNNTHMDSALAASNKALLFGQLSKMKVREVNQVRLKRFDELGGADDEVWFDAFIRHDGRVLDAGTSPIQYLQMAA